MEIKILFRVVMVTCVVVLQFAPSYCTMEILRSSAKSKIQPLFLNMSSNEETRVTTYYGRFNGPSDLVANFAETLLQKVSDGTDSSEFEMIAQFPFDQKFRRLNLESESASELVEMALSHDPGNHVQTTFSGAGCSFEVKRSREEEIEDYSCFVKDCGLGDDLSVYQDFGGVINNDGQLKRFINLIAKSEIKKYMKYFTTLRIFPSYYMESKLTLNKLTMARDNVQLKDLYFHVDLFHPNDREKVASILMWRFLII